jgi:hypothetical protein
MYKLTARNRRRANRVKNVLESYKHDELHEGGVVDEDTLQDLLTDMMHYAAQHEIPWRELHEIALANYETEAEGSECE